MQQGQSACDFFRFYEISAKMTENTRLNTTSFSLHDGTCNNKCSLLREGAASNVKEIQVVRSRFLPPLHLLRRWALGYGLR